MDYQGRVTRSAWALLLLVLCFIALSPVVEASISIVDTGMTFDSKPDRKVGQRLWKGYEYLGRLQYLDDNLCTSKKLNVVQPIDGLPVALLVRNDGCSTTAKAFAASNMINPHNTVQYLILIDEHVQTVDGLSDAQLEEDEFEDNHGSVLTVHELQELLGASERESLTTKRYTLNEEISVGNETGSSGHKAISLPDEDGDGNKDGDKIQVAILHVTHSTGLELQKILSTEHSDVQKTGGTKILLNSREPVVSFRTVLMWMLMTLLMCSCACCCMLLFMQSNFEEEQPAAAPRPVRRRLTLEQVRERFPAFHFNPEECHQQQSPESKEAIEQHHYCQMLDECTICLDEFTPGVRCRQLPCKHVFHSTCIARWLIERSAVCPLCKMDFFEEEEDENSSNAEEAEPPQPPSLLGWWATFSSRANAFGPPNAGRQQLEIPSGATGTTATVGATTVTPSTTESPGQPPESRSWSPFWFESAQLPVQEETEETQRQTSSASWRLNWFGQRRRHPTDRDMLTELTEPLVGGDRDEHLQHHLENHDTIVREVSFPAESGNSQQRSEVTVLDIPPTVAEV